MIKNLLVALALAALATGCSREASKTATSTAAPAAAKPAADANQANGAGDIPDTQAFVRYDGGTYSVLVPEGWSRTQSGKTVTFAWNADGESITTDPPLDTTAYLATHFDARAVTIRNATIAGSPGTIYSFTSHSKPDPVTGKVLTLENQAYVFAKNGRNAMLLLWAPAGADNVDQWKKISESFRWK